MKIRHLALAAAFALVLSTASTVAADRGAPGSTFPEQPGGNLQKACAALIGNPGQDQHMNDRALAITTGVVVDACFGG